MTIRPIATALGDLTSGEWFRVADRVRHGDTDRWDWHLSESDRDALLLERDIGGTVATVHEKLPGGSVRLLARRLRVKGGAEHAVPGALAGSGRVLAPQPSPTRGESVAAPVRPILARVPRSPKAWHPEDDVARARLRLAASGGGGGSDGPAVAERAVGPAEAIDGDAA